MVRLGKSREAQSSHRKEYMNANSKRSWLDSPKFERCAQIVFAVLVLWLAIDIVRLIAISNGATWKRHPILDWPAYVFFNALAS